MVTKRLNPAAPVTTAVVTLVEGKSSFPKKGPGAPAGISVGETSADDPNAEEPSAAGRERKTGRGGFWKWTLYNLWRFPLMFKGINRSHVCS